MPYITSETVAAKRKQIKAAFPDFKFSVTRRHGSSICVDILSGPLDMGTTYQQVNTFYIKEHYADRPEILNILQGVYAIAAEGKTTLTEDSDYGTVPTFYVNLNIGDWNKSYEIKK
jgi:hypothetical protein